MTTDIVSFAVVLVVLAGSILIFTAWSRETALGDAVVGVPDAVRSVARAVRRAVAPDSPMSWRELERRAARRLRREVRPSIMGKRVVPAACTISLSPRDFHETERAHDFITDHLSSWIGRLASRHGWDLPGGIPTIHYMASPSVLDGQVDLRTSWAAVKAPAPSGAGGRARIGRGGANDVDPETALAATVNSHDATIPSPADRAVMPDHSLRLVGDGIDVTVRPSDGAVSLGRSRRCVARLADRSVSAVHADIAWRSGQWVVEDRGSTNGTWIGDDRVSVHTLGGVATLRLGNVHLQLLTA